MANTAFGHDATLTTPGSTTNTALVRWANTSGSSLNNTANILSDGSHITLNARGEVRFADADSSHYIALEAPATVGTTYTMALPAAVPSANDYLKVTSYSGGAGVLEWATAGGAALTGSTDNTLVTVTGANAIAGEAGLIFDASAPTLKIRGESGAPATSSTTELAVLRLNPTGVTGTLDMGFHADATGRAWIQATDTGNLATNYNLHLNPNGGNVGIGMGTEGADATLHIAGEIKVKGASPSGGGEGINADNFVHQRVTNTRNVPSNSSSNIHLGEDTGNMVFVWGMSESPDANRFVDIVAYGASQTPVVINSTTVRGSPASRTYGINGYNLTLQMSSGIYNIMCMGWGVPPTII